MQLKSGQTIAGNMIWHTGNLNLLDDGSNLFYNGQFKLFQTGSKPDVDQNEVLNAASVNRPTINNELTVNGTTSFNPRVKFTLGQKLAQILYNNQQLNFTTTDGANINFPNVSGTVITTGNYPTWVDVGGENYLVNNNSTEIRPNQKHFVTASQQYHILPFQNDVSQIGLQNRVFNQGHFNTLNQTLLNSTSYQSSYNTGRFITFDNQSGFTHTRISGQNNTTAQDIILGFDDNVLSKTRNIILNKPLLQKTGTVIIDQDGKIDFSILKNNNKVDRAGDTLTGQLLFDGTSSSHIEFKTDNNRTGQIKQSTQLAGVTRSNEIKFLNNSLQFLSNGNLVTEIDQSSFTNYKDTYIRNNLYLYKEGSSQNNNLVLVNRELNSNYKDSNFDRDFLIQKIDFSVKDGYSQDSNQMYSQIQGWYKRDHKSELIFKLSDMGLGSNTIFTLRQDGTAILGKNYTPLYYSDDAFGLHVKGKIYADSEIPQNQNDYTLSTTKWVRSVAINEINTLKRSISNDGVTTTKVTVQDKFEIVTGTKTANLVYDNNNLVLNNNQSGNLYYKDRLVYDSTTIPVQQTQTAGIVQLNNTLQSTSAQLALTAAQGKVLNDSITQIQSQYIPNQKKQSVTNSSSTDNVATQKAVKDTYDFADQKVSKSGDTMTGNLTASIITAQNNELAFINNRSDNNKERGYVGYDQDSVSIYNGKSSLSLKLMHNRQLIYAGKKVFTEDQKPQWDDIVLSDNNIVTKKFTFNTNDLFVNKINFNHNDIQKPYIYYNSELGGISLDSNNVQMNIQSNNRVFAKISQHYTGYLIISNNIQNNSNQYLKIDQTEVYQPLRFNGADFNIHSDVKLKKDIVKIENSLDVLSKINGYHFKVKTPGSDSYRDSAGVIAQELLENDQLKKLVNMQNDGFYQVNYNALIPFLIECVKELNRKIEKLQ